MPRNITVTFEDGTSHQYASVPDQITPEQVHQRAVSEFGGKQIVNIDGGAKAPAPAMQTPERKQTLLERYKAKNQANYAGDITGGLRTAMQGLTLGFSDELTAGAEAAKRKLGRVLGLSDSKATFAEDYGNVRDRYRADVKQFSEENPMTAVGLNVAGSLPTAMIAPVSSVTKVGMIPSAIRAAKVGAGYGAVSGAGGAETSGDILERAATGAATGAALGGAVQLPMSAIGAVAGNVLQRLPGKEAENTALLKLAEAFKRDKAGAADPYLRPVARMDKLGNEAIVADTAGAKTRELLDTITVLPGKTKNNMENLVHGRQAGRSARMMGAADTALGTKGAGAAETVKELMNERKFKSAPLYAKVLPAPVTIDNEMMDIINASTPFHGGLEKRMLIKGTPGDLSDATLGATIPLRHLDILKQSLYDAASKAKRDGENGLAGDIDTLRVKLINKLDESSPKNAAGDSIYKEARDMFSGPSQMIDAVETGKQAMKGDIDNVKDAISGMSQSEIAAFRVGALNALKNKLGSESGQTSILKMWKEPNTSGRLKLIFGNDYRSFAADVAKEARIKKSEGSGLGSQTMPRAFAAADLDSFPVGDIASAAANAKAGNVLGAAASAKSAWSRVQMPEATRNRLGELLLSKGDAGKAAILEAERVTKGLARKQQSRAGSIGAELGYQSDNFRN